MKFIFVVFFLYFILKIIALGLLFSNTNLLTCIKQSQGLNFLDFRLRKTLLSKPFI